MDLAMFNAALECAPKLEDGGDMKYIARMLGKEDRGS